MNTQGRGSMSGGMNQMQGSDTPLSNATYNMVSALHNIVDALWHYDTYIEQEQDDDAREMWQRFKQQDMQMAKELRDHLSRRLQHETGAQGKIGGGPHEGGMGNGQGQNR